MKTQNLKKGRSREDLRLVSQISRGDSKAWERFVHAYSGWVLYRARKWCEVHCNQRSPETECGLAVIYTKMEGNSPPSSGVECDEGMDTYIWIFEKLSKRVTRFSARNNSSLSTFMWRILNSREFYIDWLRWKYGRVF